MGALKWRSCSQNTHDEKVLHNGRSWTTYIGTVPERRVNKFGRVTSESMRVGYKPPSAYPKPALFITVR